ncbi:MAG TPA: ABC transporter substrate-binding protein [Longimicrobiaceae bacterium]|nr:ABC transporter substrate-binding protein [Longimicrobiaceae bacterium]
MRWLHGCAAALLVLALAACGGDDRGGAAAAGGDAETFTGAPAGGTLIVLSEGEPDDLNPLTFSASESYQVVHLLFRALARRDSTLTNYDPDLLESWELQDSATVLLRIRPGVKWHDGRPVTAEDVVFTIERQKDPATASPRQQDVIAVESARAVDSATVEVKLNRTGPSTLNALLEVIPVPKHLLDTIPADRMRFATFSQRPVGNGLFRFAEWQKGRQVVVEANGDAPEGRPPLDRIVMRPVTDPTARLTEMLNGNGGLTKVAAHQRQEVEKGANVELHSAAQVRPAWIAWNTSRFPVNDPAVRRAILMGVDRKGIVQGLFGEQGQAALSPIPPKLRQSEGEVRPIPHDPAGAQQLLAQAGWRDTNRDGILDKNGRPLRVEVEYSAADPIRGDVLVAMQAQLRRIGVDLVPRSYERTTWVERLRNQEFTGSFWGWGWGPGVMGPNAEMVFHSRSAPPNGPNFAGYSNPRVDALIDSVLVQNDSTRARAIWRQLEQQVIDDAVYAPIFLDPEFYAVSERFANVKFRGPEWWEDVIYWHVPPDQRLPRDRQ